MRAKLSRVEQVAKGDKAKIWDVLITVSLVENLKSTEATALTKKLVFARMAEAEAAGAPLGYDAVEQIIEHDKDVKSDKPSPSPSAPDRAMAAFGKKSGHGKGKGQFGKKGGRAAGSWGYGSWTHQPGYQQPNWASTGQWWRQKGGKNKGGGKDKGGKGPDHAAALEEKKAALKKIQSEYDLLKNTGKPSGDSAYWTTENDEYVYEYPRQSGGTSGSGVFEPTDETDEYWSMWDQPGTDSMFSATEADRVCPPIQMGRDMKKKISRKLNMLPNMHARVTELSKYVTIPDGYMLDFIPVDSACTVTNVDSDDIIPIEHRMQASRGICVADKTASAVTPDYKGFGSMTVLTDFNTPKRVRLGRVVRAPVIRNLLSVSSLAKKGHECILNENNPRMVCKDGTVVPIYLFNDLFYMPFLTPYDTTCESSGGSSPPVIDESTILSSAFSVDADERDDPEEAIIRLATEVAPKNRLIINTTASDLTTMSEETKSRITHQAFGHVSHRKLMATSAVADGMPKMATCPTWCTSCHKGKMHVLPHPKNAWVERAKAPHDAWHLDLIGKFKHASLGGNYYILTIIDNYSRYCVVVPVKNKTAACWLGERVFLDYDFLDKGLLQFKLWIINFGLQNHGLDYKSWISKCELYRFWEDVVSFWIINPTFRKLWIITRGLVIFAFLSLDYKLWIINLRKTKICGHQRAQGDFLSGL